MKEQEDGLSWMLAAGIVGADIGTSIFYGTGILFPIVGYLAPVFVLTTCLMMWLFKMTYEEGFALSPYNGGAYSMVLRSVGRRAAVLVGALTFVSYIATAAVSSLSGGYYLTSLGFGTDDRTVVVLLAFIPIIIFGLLNTRGIKEPAKIVTAIAATHFGLLLIIGAWGLVYLGFNFHAIDFSKLENLTPSGELTFPMLIYGFSAAFLGITGFESAAQIVEELKTPVLKTATKLYKVVVILVSLTAPLISFLCLILLSPKEVDQNINYLLSGLSYKLGGMPLLYLIVIDAGLTLFAATNTAYVGFIGLATTMAKQGNLPQILLYRLIQKYPSIEGYPLIALPFMLIAMSVTALIAGEVEILAKVYEVAFLGVMVSFCLGVVLMRNRPLMRLVPRRYLSKWVLSLKNFTIPIIPSFCAVVLSIATLTLLLHSDTQALLLLVSLLSAILLLMAYYRWGVLESRLETHTDLRLGVGSFSNDVDPPNTFEKYVLCVGGTAARSLIVETIRVLNEKNKGPYELIVFHADENRDPNGYFHALIQRVVTQQILPFTAGDFVLQVKIWPGTLIEGLLSLKHTVAFKNVLCGEIKDDGAQTLFDEVARQLDVNVTQIRSK